MDICPEGAEFFHAEGRTDEQAEMTKLIGAFRNFPNAIKKIIKNSCPSHPSVFISIWNISIP